MANSSKAAEQTVPLPSSMSIIAPDIFDIDEEPAVRSTEGGSGFPFYNDGYAFQRLVLVIQNDPPDRNFLPVNEGKQENAG